MAAINGFSVAQYGAPELATFQVPGSSTRLSVRREVAPLLIGFARDFHANVEPLDPNSCWGHAPRKIRGGTAWSFHAPGIAIDLNATAHPMGRRGTFSQAQERVLRELLAKYTYRGVKIFRYGGDYTTRADEMHFEIIVPRDVAIAAAGELQHNGGAATGLKAGTDAAHRPAAADGRHGPGSRDLSVAQPLVRGDDVRYVQRWIGERRCGEADGVYGPRTKAGVVWYQNMRGVPATGTCDRATWRQMRVEPRY